MLHAAIRPWAMALLAGFLVSQHARPVDAAAQQPPPSAETEDLLQGVVFLESNGQPLESATVSLVGWEVETQTGRYGAFTFPDAPLGRVTVRVTAPGHPGVVEEVEVKSDGIVFVQFILPSISAFLSELLVGVPGSVPLDGQLTAADLLAIEVPAARVRTTANVGRNDYPIRLRGSASTFVEDADPLILLNGVLISGHGVGAMEALRQIPASDVEDIKVLKGPAAAFLYPLAANGVVAVTTRSAGRPH